MPQENTGRFKTSNLKLPGFFLISGSILIWDQLRRLRKNLFNISTPEVLAHEVSRPEYIYISSETQEELLNKFEGDGLTNELYKITRLYFWLFGQFKGSQLYENVLSFHQNLAWRYLRLAQDENYFFRIWAVNELAKMRSLTDSTCCQIAQACDQRTCIGLARTQGLDLRLLLDPPFWRSSPDRKLLIRRLHEFLLKLVAEDPHPCVQYVISRSFADGDAKTFDDDVGFFDVDDHDVIPKCMEAILHHSWVGTNALSIINLGILPLLVDVYKSVLNDPDNLETLIYLSRVISNLSMHESAHRPLFSSGCIKILAHLLQHEDIQVSMPAARALINCDKDSSPPYVDSSVFLRNVYSLYPIYRTSGSSTPLVDVVFIHGLLGGVFKTWRQRDPHLTEPRTYVKDPENRLLGWKYLEAMGIDLDDLPIDINVGPSDIYRGVRRLDSSQNKRTQCWPRDWLAKDCPEVRVIGVNYDTNISMWTPMCPIAPARQTLSDRSNHLAKSLAQAGVGSRPIVWVTHSMGGLIVKDLLVKCANSEESWQKQVAENTKGIIFFSTPHKGSGLAALNLTSQMILWPTIEVLELRQNAPPLLDLHKNFTNLLENKDIQVISFAERTDTYVKALKMELRFVEDESSDAGIGELYGVPLDHLCVCKPAIKESFLYQKVLQIVRDVVKQTRHVDRNRETLDGSS